MNFQEYSGKVLLQFADNPADAWTVDDAVKGTSIMGATGSGKTSASGKKIAKTFLKEGWGGLVLCAKSDEAALWKQYCQDTNREKDLIIFGKNSQLANGELMVFNPIDYEMKRSGDGAGETTNITNIFMNIYRMGNRIASEGDTKEERYWDTALKRCLNRVIELIKLSGENLSYANMVKILSSASNLETVSFTDTMVAIEQGEETHDILTSNNNYCLKCLINAFERLDANNEEFEYQLKTFELIEEYFSLIMPRMGSRTRSVVTESFMGLAEPFLSGILNKHFAGSTNIFPEQVFEDNKIIVLDFPVKEFLEAGIMAQCVFKQMFQQAVERRNTNKNPLPVFIWCDEAQYFVNPYDQVFLTTARSSRTATVFLSQNISNYFAVMGSGSDAKARVDSLMGNLCTKIFHANSDSETNEYASKLIGNDLMGLKTATENYSSFTLMNQYTDGTNFQFLPQVQPRKFTTLKTGGIQNDMHVEGLITVNGKTWSNGKNYLQIIFKQSFN